MEATLLQYGLAGVVIIGLSRAVYVQWKQNTELQEKRLNDLKEISGKTNTTIQELTDMTRKIYDALPSEKRGK